MAFKVEPEVSHPTSSQKPYAASPPCQNPPKTWDELVYFIRNNRPDLIGRDPEIAAEYERYRSKFDFEQNAIGSILGRSGKTSEDCYFLKKVTCNSGREYSLYIQFTRTDFHMYKQWFHSFISSWNNPIIPADTNELSDPNTNILMLTRNLFPYHIDSSIDHWLLWSSETDLDMGLVQSVVEDVFGSTTHFIHLNPVAFRSILKVLHFHVFVKE